MQRFFRSSKKVFQGAQDAVYEEMKGTKKGRMGATKPVLITKRKGDAVLQRLNEKADSLKGTAADRAAADAE